MTESDIDLIKTQWLSENESCKLLDIKIKTLREYCQSGKYIYKVKKINGKTKYFLNIKSMPQKVISELQNDCNPKDKFYSEAPEWAKVQADKYVEIIKNSRHLKGTDLQNYIDEWNILNPDNQTSYPSIIRMRRRYFADGISGLLSLKGRINRTTVIDKYYEYFKTLYLTEGAPSLRSCWDSTLGYAMRIDNISIKDFPTHASFLRRLEKEVPKQSIYLARYGDSAWNRKYGNYIDRDYSNIVCGKVWVSDHAQIDIACMTKDGNVVFP